MFLQIKSQFDIFYRGNFCPMFQDQRSDDSLLALTVPWSDNPSPQELHYKKLGFSKTLGTVFDLDRIPTNDDLITAFKQVHKNSNLFAGAKALCKHHVRSGYHQKSSRQPKAGSNGLHSYWGIPTGTETMKNQVALGNLERLLNDSQSWKNIFKLNPQTTIYEIRSPCWHGMRWTVLDEGRQALFRGYVEPHPDLG
jgi:hypothetical protein